MFCCHFGLLKPSYIPGYSSLQYARLGKMKGHNTTECTSKKMTNYSRDKRTLTKNIRGNFLPITHIFNVMERKTPSTKNITLIYLIFKKLFRQFPATRLVKKN